MVNKTSVLHRAITRAKIKQGVQEGTGYAGMLGMSGGMPPLPQENVEIFGF